MIGGVHYEMIEGELMKKYGDRKKIKNLLKQIKPMADIIDQKFNEMNIKVMKWNGQQEESEQQKDT